MFCFAQLFHRMSCVIRKTRKHFSSFFGVFFKFHCWLIEVSNLHHEQWTFLTMMWAFNCSSRSKILNIKLALLAGANNYFIKQRKIRIYLINGFKSLFQILCGPETSDCKWKSRKNNDFHCLDAIFTMLSTAGSLNNWNFCSIFNHKLISTQSYIFHVATHPVHKDFTQCVTFNTLSDTAAVTKEKLRRFFMSIKLNFFHSTFSSSTTFRACWWCTRFHF